MAGNLLTNQCSWIINFGASNHVTSCLNLLSSSNPISELKSSIVHLPNGSNTKITHIGTCILPNSNVLHNILYVPQFKYNLLSISRYINGLKSSVHFYLDLCVFQDLFKGMVKGMGRLRVASTSSVLQQMLLFLLLSA